LRLSKCRLLLLLLLHDWTRVAVFNCSLVLLRSLRSKTKVKQSRKEESRRQREIRRDEQRIKQLDATIGVLLNKGT